MTENLQEKKKVLVCPLDWGLGHASRCIPVIRKLQYAGFEVVVAADGRALALLKVECSDIVHIRLPGFSPRFSKGSNLFWKILSWMPSLAWHTVIEHNAIRKLVKEHHISAVISDNRFGLYSSGAKSIFITHQVMFKVPSVLSFTEPILYRINRFFIQKYDYCWIPDLPGDDNLSGDLSHKYPLPRNAHFIGLLSRFSKNNPPESVKKDSVLAILSGPEPQRTILEKLILEEMGRLNLAATIVSGTPEAKMSAKSINQFTMHAHLKTGELAKEITAAGMVVCRSGYSSLMDMAVLEKKTVLLVPTPGQTEQEYLAARLNAKGWFIAQNQQELNLGEAISEVHKYKGIDVQTDGSLLDEQISLLNNLLASSSLKR